MSFEIHPSIGIARVGTSQEFFPGPEPGQNPPAQYRDNAGNLKRQAARFRVFDCQRDAQGRLTSATEVTPAQATVTWKVHVVNRKAAGPNLETPTGRRNAATGDDALDKALIIDPGEQTVTGINQPVKRLDGGSFKGVQVVLGDIRTDDQGRLIFAGGFGVSDSVPPQQNPQMNFADNNGWYDDTSDGYVRATLKLANGSSAEAKQAWVITGPPDFAPSVENLVTLYDVAFQAAVDNNLRTVPATPSFAHDIQPILNRAVGYQWVNRFNHAGHSGGAPGNFASHYPALDSNPPSNQARTVLARTRDSTQSPTPDPLEPVTGKWMPRLHDETNSKSVLPLTKTQRQILQLWANNSFVHDLGQPAPAEALPDAMARVALQACSGGAFFPGIECGAIMKKKEIYSEAFRLTDNPAILKPGQLTQGNAVPWQADFYYCAWDGHIRLGWWPAQRPDHVFTEADPTNQVDWDRGISGVANGTTSLMKNWHLLGIVVPRKDAAGNMIQAETERKL